VSHGSTDYYFKSDRAFIIRFQPNFGISSNYSRCASRSSWIQNSQNRTVAQTYRVKISSSSKLSFTMVIAFVGTRITCYSSHLFWGSSESFVSRIILYSPTMVYETCNRLKNDFSVHHCKPLFTLLLGHLDLLLCSFTSLTSSNLITQFKGCCLSDLTVLLLSILQKPTAFINSSVRIYYLT